MEALETMKQTLMAAAQSQMGNLEQVNAKELGEVIDMIKDLDEAAYYCAITKSMKKSEEKEKGGEDLSTAMQLATMMMSNQGNPQQNYYTSYPYDMNRMYYDGRDQRRGYNSSTGTSSSSGQGGSNSSYSNGGSRGYYEYPYMMPPMERNYREGRSPMSRRGYMEAKESHQDKEVQMKELEKYLSELSQDITEMISDASPEEKMILQQRLNTLATKIKA